MIYRFGDYELDDVKVELSRGGDIIHIEPQVFRLLVLLAENAHRLVSKDEIIEKIWDGRFISESGVASRIKSARKGVGDDGRSQKVIKTIHGRGFRFVADVEKVNLAPTASIIREPSQAEVTLLETDRSKTERPSIAILPFHVVGIAGAYAAMADALPHDLITELSRLRWLFVIARGSSFKFRAVDIDIHQVGTALGVQYCLSGKIEFLGDRMTVILELADTRTGGIVWAERYPAKLDQIHEIRMQIVASIIANLELHITSNEARLARLRSPNNLDAWSSYHLGLQHLYRFSQMDNEKASGLFKQAIDLEPDFARAYAGLSSTHFQNAFLQYKDDVNAERQSARRFAERSLELDSYDPFANFTMGRAFWLDHDLDASMAWLDRATQLSPNYAQGIYCKAWTDTISGRGVEGQSNADLALSLSPLDPFLYAMLGTRAMSHTVRGEDAEAARWAEKAACAPGAHVQIEMIAVMAHSLNGNDEMARKWAKSIKAKNAALTRDDFFHSFPFKQDKDRARITQALKKYGF